MKQPFFSKSMPLPDSGQSLATLTSGQGLWRVEHLILNAVTADCYLDEAVTAVGNSSDTPLGIVELSQVKVHCDNADGNNTVVVVMTEAQMLQGAGRY